MPHSPHPQFLPDRDRNGRSHDRADRDRRDSHKIVELSESDNGKPPDERATLENDREWSYATEELLDALPRVWTRGLLYLVIVFMAIVLPWAILAKVDETGTARGRLEPKGKVIKLDASVAGKVAAIKVKEGQTVKAGQSLLVLESEEALATLQQAQAKLEGQQARLPLLELIEKQLGTAARTQQRQQQAQVSAQQAQIQKIRQQLTFHLAESLLVEQLLSKDREAVQRYRSLRQQGIVSEVQVDASERTMIENEQRLRQAHSDTQQTQSELKKQQSQSENLQRQGELTAIESEKQVKQIQAQIAVSAAEIAVTKSQIQSLLFQLQQRVLNAPIDGTVFQLPVKSPGVVVRAGDTLAQIAPKGTALILKAQMAVPESGFLRVGMPVKVKFDAYPFQDYGIVPGRLSWISPDSKVQTTDRDKVDTYELEITLAQPYLKTSSQQIALVPGQTATAEAIVRQRRIIDFILDPFKKLQQGGLEL